MLEFKYCECGCHGHLSATIGATSFWMRHEKGGVVLRYGHSWSGEYIGDFSTYGNAAEHANTMAKIVLAQEQVKLHRVRAQLYDCLLPAQALEWLLDNPKKPLYCSKTGIPVRWALDGPWGLEIGLPKTDFTYRWRKCGMREFCGDTYTTELKEHYEAAEEASPVTARSAGAVERSPSDDH